MRTVGTGLLVVMAVLAGCGGGGGLEAEDPAGYEACQLYAEAAGITDDPLSRMGAVFEAGERAREASTGPIRASAEPVGGSWVVDSDALEAACEKNGVDIP